MTVTFLAVQQVHRPQVCDMQMLVTLPSLGSLALTKALTISYSLLPHVQKCKVRCLTTSTRVRVRALHAAHGAVRGAA